MFEAEPIKFSNDKIIDGLSLRVCPHTKNNYVSPLNKCAIFYEGSEGFR